MNLLILLDGGYDNEHAMKQLLRCKSCVGFESFTHSIAKNGHETLVVRFNSGHTIQYDDGVVTTSGDEEHVRETLAICCGHDCDMTGYRMPLVYLDGVRTVTRWHTSPEYSYLTFA